MVRAVSRRPLPAEAPMRSQVSPRRICAGQSGTVTGVCLPALLFPPVSIIQPQLNTYLHLHVALTRRENGQRLGTLHKAMLFRNSGRIGYKVVSLFFAFKGLLTTNR